MRKIFLTFMCLIIFSTVTYAKDIHTETDFEKREIQLICAMSSLAAYSDDKSFLVRSNLSSRGWKIDALNVNKNGVKTKAYTISKTFFDGRVVKILVICGTEDLRDVDIDFRLGGVNHVDWPSLSDERRKELYDKYMKSFEKHLLDKFWEWGNSDMKEVFGVPSLHFLPEIEQVVGEFCEQLLAPYLIRDCSINIQGWDSYTGSIRLSWEDYSFLKELQHELNTQTNDGNADPVYWGVMETREEGVPDGCGTTQIVYDDGALTLKEAVDKIESEIGEYNEETQIAWDDVPRNDIEAVARFMDEVLEWKCISTVDFQEVDRLSRETGAFLTKRACQEYITRFGYNHSHPHTYAMTAYRNFELARLLKILKTIDFKEE